MKTLYLVIAVFNFLVSGFNFWVLFEYGAISGLIFGVLCCLCGVWMLSCRDREIEREKLRRY